jgi:hypothetical protein
VPMFASDEITPLFQAQNRGIVMVAFYTYFVSCNDTATIRDVVGKCSSVLIESSSAHVSASVLCISCGAHLQFQLIYVAHTPPKLILSPTFGQYVLQPSPS